MYTFIGKIDSLLLLVLATISEVTDSVTEEFCNMEEVNITCQTNEVILVHKAEYGRKQPSGRCIKTTLRDYDGCLGDVLTLMDNRCSGRRNCMFKLPDQELYRNYDQISGKTKCPQAIASHLSVEYTCLNVLPKPNAVCKHNTPIEVPSPNGYLSSSMVKIRDLGTQKCPWRIKVKAGQRINITVYNFNRRRNQGSGSDPCMVYGHIIEHGQTRNPTNINSCDSERRTKLFYSSTTSSITVEFSRTMNPLLIKYEAAGCPDIKPQPGQDVKRTGDGAEITCHRDGTTPEIYYITCKGTEWLGQKNCSASDNGLSHTSSKGLFSSSNNFPYGLVIVVAIGVALGIFFGGILLLIVSFYMKRKSQNGDYARPDYDIEYNIHGSENCYPQTMHPQAYPPMTGGNTDTMTTGMRCTKHGIPPDEINNLDNTMTVPSMHNMSHKTDRLHSTKLRDHMYEHPKP